MDRQPIVVLLVDDQQFIGAVLARLLAAEGDIALHCCVRATDAIARANEIGPTVILQDLLMPDIDGLTLVGLFRRNQSTARTPIVVLSSTDDADTRRLALAAGASDYLVKPPARDDLIACIRRQAAAPHTNIPPSSNGSAGEPEGNEPETLDAGVIAGFRETGPRDSWDFVATLIDQFIEDAERRMAVLRNAVPRRDVDEVRAAAHSLKGSAITMGARRLSGLSAQLEDAENACDSSRAPVLLAAMEAEFSSLRLALAAEQQRGSRTAQTNPSTSIGRS